jgi:DNA-binding MarR family transcriptional regulator
MTPNSSSTERFERAYKTLWGALHVDSATGLSAHEVTVLHHVGDGATVSALADHLAMPKSSTSVLLKRLADKGLVTRRRDAADERRVIVRRTAAGDAAVAGDRLLDHARLERGLRRLSDGGGSRVVELLEELATLVGDSHP